MVDKVCYGAIFSNEDFVGVFCVGINGAVFNVELVAERFAVQNVFAFGLFAKALQIVSRVMLTVV